MTKYRHKIFNNKTVHQKTIKWFMLQDWTKGKGQT